MTNNLTSKTILITGGSSRLGGEFVRRAAGEGARVFFTWFEHDEKVAELEALGAKGFQLDLADSAAIDGFARELRKETRELDVLIHNAAAVRDGMIHELSEEDWDHVMAVGLKAPYYLTKKVLPLLMKKKPSKVLMITSRVAQMGTLGAANYAAAKAGLIGLAKSLAREMGSRQVLVNAVNPGFMRSRMTEAIPQKVIEKNLEASPLGEFSDPVEVAEFLAYLSSDAMKQVTGQVLHFESRNIY